MNFNQANYDVAYTYESGIYSIKTELQFIHTWQN